MYRIVLLILAFLAFNPLLQVRAQEGSPQEENDYVLVFSSYGYEDEWATSMAKSIQKEFERRDPNILVNISYASISGSESFISGRFGMQAAFAYGRIHPNRILPSAMIFIGEESWMYYRIMNLRGIWQNVPVVLVGVRPQLMRDYSEFYSHEVLSDSLFIPIEESKNNLPMTAVMRREDDSQTIGLMKDLIPDLEQIVFLSTGNYQDRYTLHTLQSVVMKQYPELSLQVIDHHNNGAESSEPLLSMSEKSALLIHSASIPEKCSRPVFVLNDRKLTGDKLVGGYYTDVEDYAVEAVNVTSRILEGESPEEIPFSFVSEETPYLNKEALIHFDMMKQAEMLPGVKYENIPPTFFVRNMRFVLFISLGCVILLTIIVLYWRDQRYRKKLLNSFDKYRSIYNEYQVVYENMPVGLILLNNAGTAINHNQGADQFFKAMSLSDTMPFNLFESGILDAPSMRRIRDKQHVNTLVEYNDCYFRIILKSIEGEDEENETILMIVLDNTEIHKERKSKEKFYEMFNLAMNASSLGVAEYNLMDGTGFAANAWFKNLCIEKTTNFSQVHSNLLDEDRKKVETFLANANSTNDLFIDTLCVKDRKIRHWLRYIIQITDYRPEEGRVMVAELVLNIDEQVQREIELEAALKQSQESDRLKNAFIANMSSDIQPYLNELIALSDQLTQTTGMEQKQQLMVQIEHNNDILLQYINKIIELAKADPEKMSIL